MSNSWQCPFCGHHAALQSGDVINGMEYLHEDSKFGSVGIFFQSVRCPNAACKEVSLEVTFGKRKQDRLIKTLSRWRLRPESNAKTQPDYIPEPIREDYLEACLVQYKSPKAAATLARRCLQGMIRDFWSITEKTLYHEINTLKGHLEPEVWEAIDAVRSIGNIGAHMEEDINIIVEVDPEEAGLLIQLIEQLFDEWYVQRHQRTQRMSGIKAMAEAKKAAKNGDGAVQAPETE